MLQYLPGFGSVTAGGADDGSPVNDFTEEPDHPTSPQMRLEAISPRSAAMCSQRARGGMSPPRSAQSGRSSPLVFDSPASASPGRMLQAERQYWAELTGRQVQDLHEVLQAKTDSCLAAVAKLKTEVMEHLRQDVAAATNDFAALLNSLEQRLRREQQADFQAAIEAARKELSHPFPKDGEDTKGHVIEPEAQVNGVELAASTSKLRHLDTVVEEIGLRVDGLHVKLEEELSTALAEERKTRGKAISDVCQYIEHVVALQESDAKTEKRRTDSVVAGLEDRVQVLEDCFFRQPESADAVGNIGQMPVELPARGMVPGADIDFPSAHSQPGMVASPALPARTDAHSEGQAESDSGGAFTLFSEEMRESLKHIVRKVGDTMSKDSDNRAGQGSPPNMRVVVGSTMASAPSLAPAPLAAFVQRVTAAPPQAPSHAPEFGGPGVVQSQLWFNPGAGQ